MTAKNLLKQADSISDLNKRLEFFSKKLLKLPYKVHPLNGELAKKEILNTSIDYFDCTTYVEMVLALSLANNFLNFVKVLKSIRYKKSKVTWKTRQHYMHDWTNSSYFFKPIKHKLSNLSKTLNIVPGIPSKKVKVSFLKLADFKKYKTQFKDFDIVFFVSERKNLDVFHMGFIKHKKNKLYQGIQLKA